MNRQKTPTTDDRQISITGLIKLMEQTQCSELPLTWDNLIAVFSLWIGEEKK